MILYHLLASVRGWSKVSVKAAWGIKRKGPKPRLEVLEGRTAPAVFNVTTFADTLEATRDGSGLDAGGNISLRSALMATNDTGGSNTINLPAGTYLLTIAPNGSNGDDSGDLTIGRGLVENDLTITGASAATTIVDGNSLDRVFDVGFFCTATIANLTIQNGKGIFGGGISNSGRATLSNDNITHNTASHGAGVFSGGGTLMMNNCMIEGNSADQGGGISNGGTMTVADSTVAGNMAGQGGGIHNSGQLTMTGTTISGNTTTAMVGEGGGLLNQNTVSLINTTIANNMASQGGGVYTFGGPANFSNCTLAGNTASGAFFSAGGAIYCAFGNPVVTLKNTIVARNTSDSGPDVQGTFSSMGHNLIGIGDGASGLSNSDLGGSKEDPIDPLLGPLQDNGGPTSTMALLPGSPAIDAGDNAGAPNFDQRGTGFPRMVGGTIDIGAFEVQPGLATHFQISAPAQVVSNTPFDVTITAVDAYGHIAVGYLGTVTIGSSDSDPGVTLPAEYIFTSADQGVHTFVGGFSLVTVGDQTLTVTDTTVGTMNSTIPVTVT
jgi:hypothetical protein